MQVTLTDVAKHAGVSLATASRAFGEPDRLAPSTLARVRDAAGELGYRATTALPTGGLTFGIIVPDIANPVYATLVKAAQGRSWHGRNRPVIYDTGEDPRQEAEQIESARDIDGMILFSPRLPDEEIVARVGSAPAVIVNREIEELPSILMDTSVGVAQAVEHLAALGHRRLAFASGPAQSWANRTRIAQLEEACAAHGLELSVQSPHAATIQGGRAAAATIVASGATAVIAYNDLVALGIQAGLGDLGRRCPDDLSVVGIDDIEMAGVVHPGLTTVRTPFERTGMLAVELLTDAIRGRRTTDTIALASQLIVRGTTAPPA